MSPVPFKPAFEGERPTLGWQVLEWITENLARPDRTDYEPLVLTRDQAQFVLNYYALDPRTGARLYNRGVYSRPKKSGKSPLTGALGSVEALGPVVPDGWDANGRPVGKPWSEIRTPWVQFAAVNEEQTRNAFDSLLEMLRAGPVVYNYAIDPMDSFVALPKGRIEYITAAGRSKEGQRPIWCALDQTESWVPSNGGVRLADVIRRNLAGTGGASIETPNAYRPGESSVAESTAAWAGQIAEGAARRTGLLYDHREAPPDTDLGNYTSLRKGLLVAYGDAARDNGGWVDLDRIIDEIWAPTTDPQDSRQYFLNQVTHASDSWIAKPELMAVARPDVVVDASEPVVLGFDGSRGRARGNPDATALVGMTLLSKHVFVIRVWEKTEHDPTDWTPPVAEVNTVVRETFERFNVVGFYADPSGWAGQVSDWEAAWGKHLKVKASRDQPIAAWPRGKTTQVADSVERFRQAVVQEEITWDGSSVLMRHILNARRRATRTGYLIYKQFPDSKDKIDAAYAAVMAYKACLDATSAGLARRKKTTQNKVVVW